MMLTDPSDPTDAGVDLTTTWREERLEYDATTGASRARCRSGEVVSTAVVLTVAAVRDCEPNDLPPLASAVDPDALGSVSAHDTDTEVVTSFSYADCTVTVRSTGDIVVRPAEEE